MEALQGISQLNNQQQHQASPPLHSHPSIDSDEVVQILAQELENLVLSCSHEPSDRDLIRYSGDEDRMKQEEIDDEVVDVVVKEAVEEEPVGSSNGSEETKEEEKEKQSVDEVIEPESLEKVLEVDPKECRVLEEVEVAVSGLGCGNQDDEADDGDGDDDDVKLEEKLNGNENQDEGVETEIEIGDGIGGLGNDSEEERVEDGDGGEYDHVEDLENESENGGGSMSVQDDGRLKSFHYPLRPDAEDCSYYMRTGMCKFGSNCKFNHPLRRKHQPAKETQKHKEESRDVQGQIECKYYLSSAGCKYGKACKFNHGRGKTVVTPVVEYNFLGLPIRPGEKECPYYMRNGSCKYGPSCRFNHPDPSAAAGSDSPTTYANDGPLPLQPPPQPNIPNMPSWSGPRAPEPATTFVPVMYPPTQNMPPPNPDWNGYQAPAAVPVHLYPNNERGLPIPPAFFLNNPPSDKNMYTHQQPMTVTHQQPMTVSEYPERPGQPECSYFMKTGDCKYRASCKFHHPKSRITRSTRSVLSDKGLPLRPDQSICTYYSRYGICKYGPACKYDHPVNYNNSNTGRVGGAGEGYDGSDWGGPMVQQSV